MVSTASACCSWVNRQPVWGTLSRCCPTTIKTIPKKAAGNNINNARNPTIACYLLHIVTRVDQAGDCVLEALAERNLADAREAEEDLPGALVHLRRCRALSQRGRNAALEADVCRRLSAVYAEIADTAEYGSGGSRGDGGFVEVGGKAKGGDGDGDGRGIPETVNDPAEDHSETAPPEAEVGVYVCHAVAFFLRTTGGAREEVCSNLVVWII